MPTYHLVKKSGNAKVGKMPVTTTSADTCPPSCPLAANGCYADGGPLAMHWRKVTAGERGGSLDTLCADIKAFPVGQSWRHNQAGDLPGADDAIDGAALRKLAKAAAHTRGFTYTHYPLDKGNNRKLIAAANRIGGLTINVSCNGMEHVDAVRASGYKGPLATILPVSVDGAVTKTVQTPDGHKVTVCPATYKDDVSCKSCMLCRNTSSKRPVVGFPAHGFRTKKASAVAVNITALTA